MMSYTGYVGTYTSEKSEGIYAFTYENQTITDVHLFTKVRNPKYLAYVILKKDLVLRYLI